MTNDTNRIIGDFLEINSDIISRQVKSKLPKFISNVVYNRYRKKLRKTVTKLQNSNMVLTKENLAEYFIYCYNNFPPKGSYRSVNKVLYNEDTNKVEAIIKFESKQAIIDIEDNYDGFTIGVKDKDIDTGNWNNFSIHCIKLESNMNIASEVLKEINKQLLDDICIFILSNIDR